MSEHDRFVAWLFHDDELGYRWAATCGCGESFGTHLTMLAVLDAARPHFTPATEVDVIVTTGA